MKQLVRKIIEFFVGGRKNYLILRGLLNTNKISLKLFFLNSILSSFPSKHIRSFILKLYGAKIAPHVPVHGGCKYWDVDKLIIGKGSSIGYNVNLDDRMGLTIGNNVCIASDVMIWTLHHDYNDLHFSAIGSPVVIKDFAWLCSRCIILPGVTIGEGAVVASGSVVTKNVDDYTVVGGIPAKEISKRKIQDYNYIPSDSWYHFI